MSKSKITAESPLLDLMIVKQGKAPKLSASAEGEIAYQIGLSPDKKLIRIALQDSGSQGYFSREWVDADSLFEILEPLQQRAEAFVSKVFKPAFIGKSSNNAPFMAAVLLSERLLGRDDKLETKLRVIGDTVAWRKNIQMLKGKPIQVRLDGKHINVTTNKPAQIEEAEHAADSPA